MKVHSHLYCLRQLKSFNVRSDFQSSVIEWKHCKARQAQIKQKWLEGRRTIYLHSLIRAEVQLYNQCLSLCFSRYVSVSINAYRFLIFITVAAQTNTNEDLELDEEIFFLACADDICNVLNVTVGKHNNFPKMVNNDAMYLYFSLPFLHSRTLLFLCVIQCICISICFHLFRPLGGY